MSKALKISDFDRWSKRLRRLISSAEAAETSGAKLRPEETSYGVIRIACYRYLRRLKSAGLLGHLRDFLDQRDPGRWHRHKGRDADLVLRLLEGQRSREWLTPPRRGRIAVELTFAEKCGIHSEWLLPFIYECGNQELIKAHLDAAGLPEWVKKYQRASKRDRSAKPAIPDGGGST